MFRLFVLVALSVSWASSLLAQARPGYAAQFSPEDRNLLVFFDPLPHLEAILKYPPLRKVIIGRVEGPVAMKNGRPDKDDPLYALNQLRSYSQFIPQEVAIGCPERTLLASDPLIRAAMLLWLTRGAHEADVPDELEQYRKQLADAVRELYIPEITVYLRMRDANGARTIRQLMQGHLGPRLIPGMTLSSEGNQAFRVTLPLGKVLDEQMIAEALSASGAEGVAGEVHKHLASLVVHMFVEQVGDGLRITIAGDPPQRPAGLDLAQLEPGFDGARQPVMAARWDITALKRKAQDWGDFWDGTEDTAAGDMARELDAEDGGSMENALAETRVIADYGNTGSLRMWRDDALRATVDEIGAAKAEPLRDSPVMRLVPTNAGLWHASTHYDLGELVLSLFVQFEEQLGKQRNQVARQPNAQRERFLDMLELIYYEHLWGVREQLFEAPEVFKPGCVVLVQPQGVIRKLDFAATLDSEAFSSRISDWPILRLALIGVPETPEAAAQAVEKLYREALVGAAELAGSDASPPAQLTEAFQLRPDVEAHGFVAWTPKGPAGDDVLAIALDGDFRPHYFYVEGMFVFSTSTELSKQILDAAAGTGRITLPNTAGQLVSMGAAHVSVVDRLIESIASLARLENDGAIRPPDEAETQIRAALGLLGDASWQVHQSGDQTHCGFELTLSRD